MRTYGKAVEEHTKQRETSRNDAAEENRFNEQGEARSFSHGLLYGMIRT